MKKYVSILFALALFLPSLGQNVQLHYDLGHCLEEHLTGRPSVTTTVEMFKTDRWGSTFLFTDLDYFHDGVAGAYWEIAREFNVTPDKHWAAHVEYNGGVGSSQFANNATRYQHAVLAGPAYNWANADFSRTFSLQAMYKYYFKGQNPWNKPFNSFQATAVWSLSPHNRIVTFSGFFDAWYDPHVNGKWILISEPQFWLNFDAMGKGGGIPLSIGTEVEISNNFVFDDLGRNNRLHAIPTLALKWTFK